MKLRTMMGHECGEWFPMLYGGGDELLALEHDAMVACALVRAMEWYEGNSRHGHGVAGVAVALIRGRAAELLAGWGYTEHPENIGVAGNGEVGDD